MLYTLVGFRYEDNETIVENIDGLIALSIRIETLIKEGYRVVDITGI